MSLFGRWADLSLFTQIRDSRDRFGVSDVAWRAWTQQVGQFGEDIRLLAALPRSGLIAGCGVSMCWEDCVCEAWSLVYHAPLGSCFGQALGLTYANGKVILRSVFCCFLKC